jgi:hypothetical protein
VAVSSSNLLPSEVPLPRPYVEVPKGDHYCNCERKVIAANPEAFEQYTFGPPKQMMQTRRKPTPTPAELGALGFVGLYFHEKGNAT